MNYREEVEIDLVDLLHYLLLKWRSLIVCMLAGMLLVGAYGYNKKNSMVVTENVEVSPADTKSLASLGEKLSANEQKEVVYAVNAYLNYEKSYADRQRAGDNQIALKYDAFHVHNIRHIYKISDYDFNNVPEMSTVTNVDNIIAMYRNSIYYDQSVINEIKEVNNWEYEDGFVRELYLIAKDGLDMMYINASAPTKEETENIIKILDKKIGSSYSDVNREYSHTIQNIQELYFESYSSAILDQQKGLVDALMSIEKTMQQVPSAMTADQKAYYYALLNAVKTEAESENTNADPMGIASRETLNKSTKNEQSKEVVITRQFSVKYLVIGALTGFFLMLCIYIVLYVISPRLRTKGDIRDVFRLTVLGNIKDDNRYNKPFSGVDRRIDLLFEKNDRKLSGEERLELIISAACIGLKKAEAKNVYVTGVCRSKRFNDFIPKLISCIEKSSVNDGGFSLSTGDSPLVSSVSLRNLSSTDSVILVEEVGISRYDDIAKLLEVCSKFGVKVIGAVVLD